MSDAIVRLLLKTNDFDSNLKKSKNEISSFSNFMSGAGGVVAKFAGGLGLAMTAGEAFNKVLQSSQTLGDMTASNMAALKTSVDEFFYSLGTGEFSGFLSGMNDIISKAKEAYAALDQLGNTQISYGVFSAKYQSEIADAQYMAKNKFAPDDQRRASFDTWRTRLEEQQAAITRLQEELINSASKDVEAKTNANITVSMEDMLKAFEADLLDPAKRAEVKSRAKYGTSNYQANAKREDWSKEQKDALAESQKQNLIIHTMLEKYNDDELKGIAAKIQQYYQLNSALKSTAREYNKSANEYNNSMAKIKGFKPVDSLEGFKVYTGEGKTNAPSKKKKPTDLQMASFEAEGWANEEAKGLHNALRKAIESGEKIKIVPIEVDLDKIDIADELADPLKEAQIKKADEYTKALEGVGYAMEGINSIAQASGEQTIGFITESFASIAQMIISLNSLAVANGVANAAALPFPANLAAIATVVGTISSIFSSLPKFADGGIIGGSSFFGDKMIARVNSGEMILNQSQQGKLFNIINNGNPGNNITVGGEAKVSGKTMYIAIRNYMKSENVKW